MYQRQFNSLVILDFIYWSFINDLTCPENFLKCEDVYTDFLVQRMDIYEFISEVLHYVYVLRIKYRDFCIIWKIGGFKSFIKFCVNIFEWAAFLSFLDESNGLRFVFFESNSFSLMVLGCWGFSLICCSIWCGVTDGDEVFLTKVEIFWLVHLGYILRP